MGAGAFALSMTVSSERHRVSTRMATKSPSPASGRGTYFIELKGRVEICESRWRRGEFCAPHGRFANCMKLRIASDYSR